MKEAKSDPFAVIDVAAVLMSQTERVLRIHQMLQERNFVSGPRFLEELEISRSQFKRDLAFLRDRFQLPIEWDSERRGYTLGQSPDSPDYELPGPMYDRGEILALLVIENLLAQMQPGLLEPHLDPLRKRLQRLLGGSTLASEKIGRRVRILPVASRPVGSRQFQRISEATLGRRRLLITHYSRMGKHALEREISPQRLLYYRANWYLDSWCHLRGDMRRFAVDAIQQVLVLKERAHEVDPDVLDRYLERGYGIFSGTTQKRAVLRFEPEIAEWVSREQWHADQEQQFDQRGGLILTVPYAQDQELVMDILRYGPRVTVIEPTSLKQRVQADLVAALGKY